MKGRWPGSTRSHDVRAWRDLEKLLVDSQQRSRPVFLKLEVGNNGNTLSGSIDTAVFRTPRDDHRVADDTDGLRPGSELHCDGFLSERRHVAVHIRFAHLVDRFLESVPLLDGVDDGERADAGRTPRKNLDVCDDFRRVHKTGIQREPMMKVE